MINEYNELKYFINGLKENGLNEFKIIDKVDYFVIYIFIKRDENVRGIINKISYDVYKRFNIYKAIQCQYLYDWYKDFIDFENDIRKNKIIDITNLILN